jgi:germination protein, Ger(x)C family
MKKKMALIILLILSLLLTGCWDYSDYDDLALISAIGVDLDKNTNEVTVILQNYVPSAANLQTSGKSIPISAAVKAKGATLTEALSKIQKARRKRLFYAYLNVVVVGENASKKIITDTLQYFERSPNVRTTAYLAITKGKAEDVLTTMDPNVSVTIGQDIYGLIEESPSAGSAFPVSIEDFMEKLAISGIDPVAPIVTVKQTKKSKEGSSSENTRGDGLIKFSKLKEGYQTISGMAAFKGDKLVGWLNVKESTGLGWILNKDISPYEEVKTSSKNRIQNTMAFSVSKSKSKIKVELAHNKPVITVDTNIEADLRKYAKDADATYLTPDALALAERGLSDKVKSEIKAAIKKGQKDLKTDIFGFGFAFYRKYPSLWHEQYEKKWKDTFANIQINVNVTAKIINTGSSIKKFVIK